MTEKIGCSCLSFDCKSTTLDIGKAGIKVLPLFCTLDGLGWVVIVGIATS